MSGAAWSTVPPVPTITAAYKVYAAADPGVVVRLLNFFAQLDMVPGAVQVRRYADELTVKVEQPGITEHAADVIAEKMRSLVTVNSVELECRLMRIAA
jgi:hypothetical protein